MQSPPAPPGSLGFLRHFHQLPGCLEGVAAPFLIQDVQVSQIGFNDNVYPLFTGTAASSIFTLQNLLQNVQLQ